jgi:hypothetical protein
MPSDNQFMNFRHAIAYVALAILFHIARDANGNFDSGRVNFDIGAYGSFNVPSSFYNQGAGAIGSFSDIWNSYDGSIQSPVALVNSAGAQTDVVTEWHYSSLVSSYDVDLSGTYDKLFSAVAYTRSVEIRGLTPGALYDFYLYTSGGGTDYTIAGVNFSAPSLLYSTNPVNSLVAGVHYDTHTVTASLTGILDFAQNNPLLTAWQITPHAVPEPMCLLQGVGVAGFLIAVSRGRRCSLLID